jgi:hypothetical protein
MAINILDCEQTGLTEITAALPLIAARECLGDSSKRPKCDMPYVNAWTLGRSTPHNGSCLIAKRRNLSPHQDS